LTLLLASVLLVLWNILYSLTMGDINIFFNDALSLLLSYLYIDINNSNDILYCRISLLLYHYDWCHLRHHAQAIFSENFQALPIPNKIALAVSLPLATCRFRPGPKNGIFFWDPIFRVEWLERSLKKKMCIFCPISFNKFKMWGLKTWVSPRKTCRKGRLRVLVGIMSRRRTEKLVVPAGKKKTNQGRLQPLKKPMLRPFGVASLFAFEVCIMKSKLQSINSCWKCGEMSWILS